MSFDFKNPANDIGLASGLIGLWNSFNGSKTPTQTPSTTSDLLPMRAQQIALLNYLMGFGPDPRTNQPFQLPSGLWPFTSGQPSQNGGSMSSQQIINAWRTHPGSGYNPSGVPTTGGVPFGGRPSPTGNFPTNFGQPTYATGGVVAGPGTGTSDSIPAFLSNGEGVLTAETVRRLGGQAAIDAINKGGAVPHFAYGGVVGQTGGYGYPPVSGSPGGQGGLIGSGPGITSPTGGLTGQQGTSDAMGGIQTPQQRLESFYGPLGMSSSGLQNQASNGYSNFLNQMSPAERAIGVTQPQLTQNMSGNQDTQGSINRLMGLQTGAGADVSGRLGQIGQGGGSFTGNSGMDQLLSQMGFGNTNAQQRLSQLGQGSPTGHAGSDSALYGLATGQRNGMSVPSVTGGGVDPAAYAALQKLSASNPGQGVVDSLQPLFQQNLGAADQSGGRFGSGNALMRGQAVNQFNNTAANALQQGATQQQQAATSLGDLANGANAQNVQAGMANASNALQSGQIGGAQQLQALGLAQTGNLGQGSLALGANQALQSGQGNAMGQQIGANAGLNANTLQALSQLGGFNLQGGAQQAQNANNAGQLGIQQGNMGNNAASIMGQLYGQQGSQQLAGLQGAGNLGGVLAQQGYQGQQNTINLMQQILGQANSASLGGPVVSTPGAGTQGASALAGLLPFLSQIGNNNTPQPQPQYYNPYTPQNPSTPTPNGYGTV